MKAKLIIATVAGALLMLAVSGASATSLGVLHHFSLPDGTSPAGQFVDRGDGFLYGVTPYGGTVDPSKNPDGYGTFYRIDATGTFQTLHRFDRINGERPIGLIRGADGFLYGTTSHGGDLDPGSYSGGQGTLFRVDAAGNLTVLHRFMPVQGSWPLGPPAFGPDGALYGTSSWDSTYPSYGTVWRWTSGGGLTVLHQFSGPNGNEPMGPLTLADDGFLYGTTNAGGMGCGTVFRIEPPSTFKLMHSFTSTLGCQPKAGVIQASDGNFYGTTERGGSGWGNVFRMDKLGNVTQVYAFDAYGSTGMKPAAALFQGTDGFLYGTAQIGGQPVGGPSNHGVVFRTGLAGNLTVVHTFTGPDGSTPQSGVVQWTDGALYGVTPVGGSFNRGVAYRLDPTGTTAVTLTSLTLSSSSVKAGSTVTGTVALSGPAPAGGAAVQLTSSNTQIATVPGSVTVPAGATTASFTVKTYRGKTGSVSISATYNGVKKTAKLTVTK